MFGLGASDGWVITQYGETLASLPSEMEAMRWLHHRQSQSIDWAARNNGYDLLQIKDGQILFSYRRDILGKEIEKAVNGKLNLETASELFEESVREAFIRVYGLPNDLGKIEQSIKSSYLPAGKKLGWTKPDPNVVLVLTEHAWVPDPFNSTEDFQNWQKVGEILRAIGWPNAASDSINTGVQMVYWRSQLPGQGMHGKGDKFCKSCGDVVERFDLDTGTKIIRVNPDPYCQDCWLEKNKSYIPKVTDQSNPPSGTGTVPRQKHGRGRTSG